MCGVKDFVRFIYNFCFFYSCVFILFILINKIRYDTIEEFNVDSKAECGRLNLAHEMDTI